MDAVRLTSVRAEPGLRASGGRRGLAGIVRGWLRNASTRSALRDLPGHLLDDVGLNARDARREGSKPFWQE